MMRLPSLISVLVIFVVNSNQEVFSRPLTGNQGIEFKYPLNPYGGALHRRQEVVAVPPVATSILEGPYLPPAYAENELFVGPHGIPSPLHHGYPTFPGGPFFHQPPHFPHPGFHSSYLHPAYRPIIPLGLRHGYHTHWPHMQVSGPVFLADPNDGMYQEPVTGTLVPRPVIPPQYPGFMPHTVDTYGYHHPGSTFLGGHGPSFFPVDTTSVEDQIVDNNANMHSSPLQDVAERMAQITREEELEKLKLMKAMNEMKSKPTIKKPPKK